MTARIQGIDLLRGIAVGLVMLRHAFPVPFAGAGVVGVVMFFTLSGHLITGVLIGELGTTGRLNLRRFYARRAIRLVPALVVMMAVLVVVTLTLDPLHDRAELLRTVIVALTWTADLPFHHGSDATFHLWTLAMEEQFYLLWPAVLALAWVRGATGRTLAVTGVLCVAGCVATLVWLSPNLDLAYTLPTSWAVCFVIGAASRVYADCGVPARWAAPAALIGLLALSVIPLRGHALTYLVGGPVIAVLTAVLLLAWRQWFVVSGRGLRVLVLLGTVSYGGYLWNYPLTLWLRPSMGDTAGLVAVPLTVLAAALSWVLVERPLMRIRRPALVAA